MIYFYLEKSRDLKIQNLNIYELRFIKNTSLDLDDDYLYVYVSNTIINNNLLLKIDADIDFIGDLVCQSLITEIMNNYIQKRYINHSINIHNVSKFTLRRLSTL